MNISQGCRQNLGNSRVVLYLFTTNFACAKLGIAKINFTMDGKIASQQKI